MIISFTEYMYPEDWDFVGIVRETGFAHEVDGVEITRLIWEQGGTRELAVNLELDTETGIIKVVS